MKKWISLFLAAMLVLAVAGCGRNEDVQEDFSAGNDSVVSSGPADADSMNEPSQAPDDTANGETLPSSEDTNTVVSGDTPIVYMTTDISPEGLLGIRQSRICTI